MKNSFSHLLNNKVMARRSPSDGMGGTRRSPSDGMGGTR